MEIIVGLILFLQVFAFIQHMLVHGKMLQEIRQQQEISEKIFEILKLKQDSIEMDNESKEEYLTKNMDNKGIMRDVKQGNMQTYEPEVLINEVLSEVFS